MIGVTKQKISGTLDPGRLKEAKRLTGQTNVSAVLNDALDALVERERERAWLAAHPDDDLPGEVPVELSSVPWDDE